MKRRSSGIAAAALVATACCHAADLYRVSGVVVDAETGAPHPRARLAVMPTGTPVVVARQIAGADGLFSFDLPQGKYDLRSGDSDDPQVYGRKTSALGLGSSLIVGPGQDNSKLVFRWIPRGAISGRIVDEAGEPVESALIQLVRSHIVSGRRVTVTAAWRRSEDRGEYRFGLVPGSTYYLAVTGTPWYAEEPLGFQVATPPFAYATVYYPNSSEPAGAAPLVLKPGAEVRADFTLRTVPGATVTVELESPQPITGNLGLVADGIGASDGFERQERFTGGRQRLEAVPPGHYQVRLAGTSGETSVGAKSTIDVNGSGVAVKLSPKPYPSVGGTVRLKNPGAKPKGSILASLVSEEGGGALSTAVRADGAFSFPSVLPGKYRLAIRGKDGYFASDVHVDGAPYVNGVLELTEGQAVTVRMVASDETGRVGGFAMSGEQPVMGAFAVLAPAVETGDWQAYHCFQTDSDGSYDFQNIPAGDYLLFAVEDLIEYANPKAVEPYLSSAKPLRVEPHGSYSERIPVVNLAGGR
jgi:hypothetical protein